MTRFSELIDANDAEDARSVTVNYTRSFHEQRAEGPEIFQGEDGDANARASMASAVESSKKGGIVVIRGGVGIAEKMRPLRKRRTQA